MMRESCRRGVGIALAGTFILFVGVLPTLASGPHLAKLIRKDGGSSAGKIRYLASSRTYEIRRGNTSQQVSATEVAKIILKTQPAGLSAAIANVKRGNYAAAVPVLKKVMSDYEMFGPDVAAGQYLAKAYLGMGKAADADRLCRQVLASNSKAMNDPEFTAVYWEALLKEKKYATLNRSLDEAIQTGDRSISAVALIKRGDILVAKGDAKAALRDGFLRVVLMYRDIKSVQPEALYKAIKAHQSLGENTYAEKWRKLLLSGYPTSPYAKKM